MKLIGLFICVLSLTTSTQLWAQKAPMKYGKIPQEDLEMKHYDKDPEAAAVVLANYADAKITYINGGFELVITYHKRIKIFNKSAFNQADVSIPFYTRRGLEEIEGIRAQTVNQVNGEISISKVSNKDIFEEVVSSGLSRKKFSFPGVKEGSIIEYKYIYTKRGVAHIDRWYFQEDIPTRWSEFRFVYPNFFEYVMQYNNSGLFDIKEREELNSVSFLPGVSTEGVYHRYVVEDAPAMVEESYVTTMTDYYGFLKFQLSAIRPWTTSYQRKEFLTSWARLKKNLYEHENFGMQLLRDFRSGEASKIGEKFKGIVEPEEKIAAVYYAVANSIAWNGRYNYVASQNLSKVIKESQGNSADINLSLIVALNAAGIDAKPVLISTRSHGKMFPIYPILDQFNHLIVYAKVEGKDFLMDATSTHRPFDLLPVNDLNHQGLLISDGIWLMVKPKPAKSRETVVLKMNEEGEFEGKLMGIYQEYSAHALREEIRENNQTEFLNDYFEEESGLVGTSVEVENLKNPLENLKINLEFTGASAKDDFIYLNPVLNSIKESPFKLETREYPVDLAYPLSEMYVLNLEIPNGYAVEELPESVAYAISGKRGLFTFQVENKQTFIQLMSRIEVSETYFEPADYPELKLFFEKIVEKQAEQIVLKRVGDSTAGKGN